jgi:hypothetical protein
MRLTTACQNLVTSFVVSHPGLEAAVVVERYSNEAGLPGSRVSRRNWCGDSGGVHLVRDVRPDQVDRAWRHARSVHGTHATGFSWHATAGIFVLPVISLLFLISSFFAKVPGGIRWALIVFGMTVLQVALGLFSHSVAGLGWLHGINALALFGTAVMAGMRVSRAVASKVEADEPVAAPAS